MSVPGAPAVVGASGISVTVVFDGSGWLQGVAIAPACLASEHVHRASAAWTGIDALVRTTAPGPWLATA